MARASALSSAGSAAQRREPSQVDPHGGADGDAVGRRSRSGQQGPWHARTPAPEPIPEPKPVPKPEPVPESAGEAGGDGHDTSADAGESSGDGGFADPGD